MKGKGLRSGGPRLGFSGRLAPVGQLIAHMSKVFGARYDESIPHRGELLEKLNSPTWLIETLRKIAQRLPDDHERDWTDNQAKLMDDRLSKKRKREDYRDSEQPRTKRSNKLTDCILVTHLPMVKD